MKFTRRLDNEMIYDKDPEAGINPGLVSGISYTDSNSNSRNKYETLKTLSSTTIKKLKADVGIPPIQDDGEPPMLGETSPEDGAS